MPSRLVQLGRVSYDSLDLLDDLVNDRDRLKLARRRDRPRSRPPERRLRTTLGQAMTVTFA